MKRFMGIILFILLTASVSAQNVKDFSAEYVQRYKNSKSPFIGRLFYSESLKTVRLDAQDPKTRDSVMYIADYRNNTTYRIHLGSKTYLEMPGIYFAKIFQDPVHPCKASDEYMKRFMDGSVRCEKSGRETIEGHSCTIWKLLTTMLSQKITTYQWIENKTGILFKVVSDSLSQQISHLKYEPQPDSLFALPAGLTKQPMPKMNFPGKH